MAIFPCLAPFTLAVRPLAARLACGVGLAVAMAACSPALNWRAVQVPDADGLSALFPCKPERIERRIAWHGVPEGVVMHMLACEAQGLNWSLSYVTLPEVGLIEPALRQWPEMVRANIERAGQALQGGSAAVLATDRGPVSVPRMTPSDHAHAWYFEGVKPDARGQAVPVAIHTWHFFHGMTVLQASVSGAPEGLARQSSEDVTQAFFGGFHFPG